MQTKTKTWNPTSPDNRPGDYFVSAIRNDGDYVLLAGPFRNHQAALDMVTSASRAAYDIDHRAPWYSYGTCRMEHGSGLTGKLNRVLNDLCTTNAQWAGVNGG
jgi:hypothetical protein